MTHPIRIWTSSAYQAGYRCGGWAAVRVCQGQVTGVAGGERDTTAHRMALAGLVAALRDVPAIAGEAIAIHTTNAALAEFVTLLADLGRTPQGAAPEDNLDLWAQIFTAANGRRLNLVRVRHEPGTPNAFTAAWADLALDKAKAAGVFTSAIPKANLAKILGLGMK